MNLKKGLAKILIPLFALTLACAFAPAAFAVEDISGATVVVNDGQALTYNGLEQTPPVTVTLNGKTLNPASDYTVHSWSNNKDAGTGTVTIMGTDNYTGTKQQTFTINPLNVKDPSLKVDVLKYEYTGKQIKANPIVYLNNYDPVMVKGVDYTLKWGKNVKVGKNKGKIIITGKGNLKGKRTVKFTITRASIESARVSPIKDTTYTGNPIKPTPTVKYKKKTLKSGKDYALKYEDNVNAGTAKVIIKGKGNLRGKKTVEFKIEQKNLQNAVKYVGLKKKYAYTGYAIEPITSIKVAGRTLEEGKDYSLSYTNNVELGQARITVLGKGNYIGSDYAYFQIVEKKAAKK